jgi:hypothetical protein
LSLTIKDANNLVTRTLHHKGKAGINRVWWDLREDPSTTITVRTKPLYADWIDIGDKRAKPAPTATLGVSPLIKPGDYSITLKFGEKEFTHKLKVLKDPNSEGSEADIASQYDLIADAKKDLVIAANLINQMEWIRRQIYDLKAFVQDAKRAEEVITAMDAADAKLMDIEGNLIQLKITGQGQGGTRWPAQVVEKMRYLVSTVETADFPPTNQQREVHQVLKKRLQDEQTKLNQFLEKDFPDFMELLKKYNFDAPVIIKTKKD